jgi:hypothetical protein
MEHQTPQRFSLADTLQEVAVVADSTHPFLAAAVAGTENTQS